MADGRRKLRNVSAVRFQPRVAIGGRGEQRHTVRPVRTTQDTRARVPNGRRARLRGHAKVHEDRRSMVAGRIPVGRDGLRTGHPAVSRLQ